MSVSIPPKTASTSTDFTNINEIPNVQTMPGSQALALMPQWKPSLAYWKHHERKWGKRPLYRDITLPPESNYDSHTNHDTCTTLAPLLPFLTAYNAKYADRGRKAYPGFFKKQADGIVVIDLDYDTSNSKHCLNAERLIAEANSFTTVTMSNRRHIYLRTDLEIPYQCFEIAEGFKVEFYTGSKYLHETGAFAQDIPIAKDDQWLTRTLNNLITAFSNRKYGTDSKFHSDKKGAEFANFKRNYKCTYKDPRNLKEIMDHIYYSGQSARFMEFFNYQYAPTDDKSQIDIQFFGVLGRFSRDDNLLVRVMQQTKLFRANKVHRYLTHDLPWIRYLHKKEDEQSLQILEHLLK